MPILQLALSGAGLVVPSDTAKIGQFEYDVGLNASPRTVAELNDLPIKVVNTVTVYLTPREREVMLWVASGLLNKQITGVLGTSEITVKVHRAQVMQKMGADSLADLVRMAARLGIGPPSELNRAP